MITPADDFLGWGIAKRVTLKVPVRSTAMTFSHSAGFGLSNALPGIHLRMFDGEVEAYDCR